jgi:hypothetical protein
MTDQSSYSVHKSGNIVAHSVYVYHLGYLFYKRLIFKIVYNFRSSKLNETHPLYFIHPYATANSLMD